MNMDKNQRKMTPLKIPKISGYWTKQKSTTIFFTDMHHSIRAKEELDIMILASELKNRDLTELTE